VDAGEDLLPCQLMLPFINRGIVVMEASVALAESVGSAASMIYVNSDVSEVN
jgi:hypothetical protein